MSGEVDYGAMIFSIAKRSADAYRVKFALERVRSLQSHLLAERGGPHADLIQAVLSDLAYVEKHLSEVNE